MNMLLKGKYKKVGFLQCYYNYCASHGEFGQHLLLPQGGRSLPKFRRHRRRNFSTTFIVQLCIQVVQFWRSFQSWYWKKTFICFELLGSRWFSSKKLDFSVETISTLLQEHMSAFVNDANKSIVCGAPPISRDFVNSETAWASLQQ